MTDVDIDLACKNRWRSILPALGVDARFLTDKQGPCPVCEGKTRFRFDDQDGRGTSFCQHCPKQSRTGFQLLQDFRGWSFIEAKQEVLKVVGLAPVEVRRDAKNNSERARAERVNIWKGSHNLSAVEAVRLYWLARVGFVPTCTDLRASDKLYHNPTRRLFPGMIARMVSADGSRAVQLHRTYLSEDGSKAPVDPARLLMPKIAEGEMNGGAVRLAPFTDRLGIAEGIETAVSVTKIFGIPCWAALNAGNLAKWSPPPGVKVTIFADNDALTQFEGQRAAFELAHRLTVEGFTVEDVMIPSAKGEDWNDAWAVHQGLPSANDHPQQQRAA